MKVIKKCYINTDENKDNYCIIHLPNASESDVIKWFNDVFIKSDKLIIIDFEKHFIFAWMEEKGEEEITHLATYGNFVLTKWQERNNEENFVYSIQEIIYKSEFLIYMFTLGVNHKKFNFAGIDEYATWLFEEGRFFEPKEPTS